MNEWEPNLSCSLNELEEKLTNKRRGLNSQIATASKVLSKKKGCLDKKAVNMKISMLGDEVTLCADLIHLVKWAKGEVQEGRAPEYKGFVDESRPLDLKDRFVWQLENAPEWEERNHKCGHARRYITMEAALRAHPNLRLSIEMAMVKTCMDCGQDIRHLRLVPRCYRPMP